jgi:hypothetical protein
LSQHNVSAFTFWAAHVNMLGVDHLTVVGIDEADAGWIMPETSPDADEDRRKFLAACGRFSADTPPTITLLQSTSLCSVWNFPSVNNDFKNEVFSGFGPNPIPACSHCGEKPALVLSMLNPANGRSVRMFKCGCGEQTWTEDKS